MHENGCSTLLFIENFQEWNMYMLGNGIVCSKSSGYLSGWLCNCWLRGHTKQTTGLFDAVLGHSRDKISCSLWSQAQQQIVMQCNDNLEKLLFFQYIPVA